MKVDYRMTDITCSKHIDAVSCDLKNYAQAEEQHASVNKDTLPQKEPRDVETSHGTVTIASLGSNSLCSRLIIGQRYTMQMKHNSSAGHAVDVTPSYGSGTWLLPRVRLTNTPNHSAFSRFAIQLPERELVFPSI
jgi:hypothetical protein